MRSLFALGALTLLLACSDSHGPGDGGGGRPDAASDGGGVDAPPADWSSCEYVGDCVLSANGCCGVCGQPTVNDVDAVNLQRLDEHYADVCTEDPVICPGCAEMTNPWLIATCQLGQCAALDVAQHDVTACRTTADCVLRVRDCCACGASTDPYNLIAVAQDSMTAYLQLVCDPRADCATCEPVYPTDAHAACSAGHCTVLFDLGP